MLQNMDFKLQTQCIMTVVERLHVTSLGRGFQGSHDLLHGNVYTKVYGELINFAASYSRFIAILFYGLAGINI